MELMDHQTEVIDKISSGKILYGVVGSGKSATILAYYKKYECPRDIYVITTARKRGTLDWEREAANFGITDQLSILEDHPNVKVGVITVDSWNNLHKYTDIKDAFFIFDEQRLVGYGAWTKSFLKIAKQNHWVMLSATPGDTWMDYAPIFIANGYFANITDFKTKHVMYEPFSRYPKIRGYLGTTKLNLLRNEVLVEMSYERHTERFLNYIDVDYDKEKFKAVYEKRWNIYEDRPVTDIAELFRLMRRVVNSDPARVEMLRFLMKAHPRLIVFYNFDYELDILRGFKDEIDVFEYNGHVKDPLPTTYRWLYLVQYVAGAEAWNCTTTDAMVLYSLTYSYKNFEQVQGRIDRLDTLFSSLYYYIFVSNSVIDLSIRRSLDSKQSFNERKFLRENKKIGAAINQEFDHFRKSRQI